MTTTTHRDVIKEIKQIQDDPYAGAMLAPALIQIIRAAKDDGGRIGLDDILAIAADHLSD
jgi:hypothetical protein